MTTTAVLLTGGIIGVTTGNPMSTIIAVWSFAKPLTVSWIMHFVKHLAEVCV